MRISKTWTYHTLPQFDVRVPLAQALTLPVSELLLLALMGSNAVAHEPAKVARVWPTQPSNAAWTPGFWDRRLPLPWVLIMQACCKHIYTFACWLLRSISSPLTNLPNST